MPQTGGRDTESPQFCVCVVSWVIRVWRHNLAVSRTPRRKTKPPEMTGGEGKREGYVYIPCATRKSLLTVGVVFALSAFLMLSVFWNFPQLDE